MDRTYQERLMKFAQTLEHMEQLNGLDIREAWVDGIYDDLEMYFTIFYAQQIIDALIKAFPKDWFEDEEYWNLPSLIWQPNNGLFNSIMLFFDLQALELIHLLDVSGKVQKPERWGGKILSENSQSSDFAHNIYEFIKAKK